MNKTYLVKYRVILEGANPIEDKEIKVKNSLSGVEAQIKLEGYLKKKYENFKQLIVSECKEDYDLGNLFGGLGDNFGDLFAGGNLFGGKNG